MEEVRCGWRPVAVNKLLQFSMPSSANQKTMKTILVAGSTGYLGSHIVEYLKRQAMDFKAIARNTQKLEQAGLSPSQIIRAEVTDPATLTGCCEGIDTVISTVGITRQKDGLTYMDVDYQANKNLLEEALKSF